MIYYIVLQRILDNLDVSGHPMRKDKTPSPAKEDEICSAVLSIEVVASHIRVLP